MNLVAIAALLSTYIVTVTSECQDDFNSCEELKYACSDNSELGNIMKDYCKTTCNLCYVEPSPPPVQSKPLPPHFGGCGTPDIQGITRVIAGVDAVRGSWPWQILMLYNKSPICGGTLIAPQWVVTAAHCVYGSEDSPFFSIRVGEHDTDVDEGSEDEINVAKIFRHPGYAPDTLDNDIAMFKLERPILFNKYVSPICLPKGDIPVGSKCFITGWGKIVHPGGMTQVLQEAILPVVSNEVCYEKNKDKIPIPITDAMICGGSGGTSRQSGCHGDSGGPYVCRVGETWELHGSVSHGSPVCSSTETYTVFARTYHFLDWINGNMNNN